MANGSNYSRTSNISESVHSSLNRRFNRRMTFESAIQALAIYKEQQIVKKAALIPINFLNQNPAPSKKKVIKASDEDRLRIIYEKVRIFNALDADTQLLNLKMHLIDVGGRRRNLYQKNNNVVFQDFSDSDSN